MKYLDTYKVKTEYLDGVYDLYWDTYENDSLRLSFRSAVTNDHIIFITALIRKSHQYKTGIFTALDYGQHYGMVDYLISSGIATEITGHTIKRGFILQPLMQLNKELIDKIKEDSI